MTVTPRTPPIPLRSGTDNPRALAAVLVLLAAVSTAMASLGAPLLPTVVAEDHVSLAASQWTLTITLVVGAVVAPVLGRLGDGHRRRTTILASTAATAAGCVVSALPLGFAGLLAGRAVQGVAFALVPLVIAVARDSLPPDRSSRTIATIGITTAAGIGAGYPLVGLLAGYDGVAGPFWVGALVSGVGLVAAALAVPPGPDRPVRLPSDIPLLAIGIAALLFYLAQGQWLSLIWLLPVAVVALTAWVVAELRAETPLVRLRMLRSRPVLAANVTGLLLSLGFYPIGSLLVRLVQTPQAAGYGFGASAVVGGLMLTPFSLASFLASKVALPVARRASAALVVAAGCGVAVVAMALFAVDRSGYPPLFVTSALIGFAVGCVFALNPLQIAQGVPPSETGSANSFYQLTRAVAYAFGSALSATVLAAHTAPGVRRPDAGGYSAAAWLCVVLLTLATIAACAFAAAGGLRRGHNLKRSGRPSPTAGGPGLGKPGPAWHDRAGDQHTGRAASA